VTATLPLPRRDHRVATLSAGYGGEGAGTAIMWLPGFLAAVLCLATPWPLDPPLWLAVVAALLCGGTVSGAVLVARGLFRLVRRVVGGRVPRMAVWSVAVWSVAVLLAGAAAPQAVPGVPSQAAESQAAESQVAVVRAVGSPDAGPQVSSGAGWAIAGEVAAGRAFLDLPVSSPRAPVRAYVAHAAAADDAGRAALAVETLRRAGGLERGTVLVAVPTGSGWVDGAAVTALEQRLGGDVATVAVQYAERPSWVEFVLGGDAADRSAAAVVAAVRAALPPDGPRLLLFGESLGAAAALPLAPQVDGCLLAGRPGSADDAPTGCAELRNADDPVVRWSTRLDPVTFWQVTASLLIAQDAGPDHGHRYGQSFVSGWAAVDQPRS